MKCRLVFVLAVFAIRLIGANSGLVVTEFSPQSLGGVQAIAVDANGGCIVATRDLYRLNLKGEVDPSFTAAIVRGDTPPLGAVFDLQVDAQRRVLVLGSIPVKSDTQQTIKASVVRFESDGRLDGSFSPVVIKADGTLAPSGMTTKDVIGSSGFKALQTSTGEIWVAGDFNSVNGTSRQGLAKLSANGALLPTVLDSNIRQVYLITKRSDGRPVIAFMDQSLQQVAACLNADGSLDQSYPVCKDWSSITTICGLSSGHLLICGSLAGSYRKCGRIYGADGLRLADIPLIAEDRAPVFASCESSDGKILLSGTFVDPITQRGVLGVRRVMPDGTLDETWTSLCNADGRIQAFAPIANGDVFMRGPFRAFEGIDTLGVALISGQPSRASSVSNISSMSSVDNAHPSILGFVVQGNQAIEVLIRAVGPSLVSFGSEPCLKRPSMEVYNGNTLLMASEGWTDTPSLRQIQDRCGAFPLLKNGGDCVVRCILAPGPHTVMVRAAQGDSGAVLGELYKIE